MTYLQSIENEFSRLLGRATHLSPMDWTEADGWETSGVPLHIVFNAMADGFKKFAAKNTKGEINSIRYFIPIVNQQFAEWRESQVGKSPDPILREETTMQNQTAAMTAQTNEGAAILDRIADALLPDQFTRRNITLPELLAPAVAKLRGEIFALLDDANQKNLSLDDIEARLSKLRAEFELVLIISVTDDERARIIKEVEVEYDRFRLMPDVQSKVLIRKLYQKFALPELSLFAL